jgi:hypothetical protein
MATILERLNEKISSLGVAVGELPNKTQRKIADLKKKVECKLPTVRDKEGKFVPSYREKIQDLLDDIMTDAEAFADHKNDSVTPPPPPAPKPSDPPTPKLDDVPPVKKKSGLFDYLFD